MMMMMMILQVISVFTTKYNPTKIHYKVQEASQKFTTKYKKPHKISTFYKLNTICKQQFLLQPTQKEMSR